MNSIIAGMRGGREGAREVAGQISRPCASGRETAAASPLLGVLSFGGDEEWGAGEMDANSPTATGRGAVGRGGGSVKL